MAAPSITAGRVEQAIYTWSEHTMTGGSGQGWAEVSAGLRDHLSWLQSLDLKRFRPFEETVVSEAEGYSGWEQLVTIGVLPAGDLNVVYRKIAKAGKDKSHRNRYITQILVGNADELNLATISEADSIWLAAEDCPTDKPPRLSDLSIEDLDPRRLDHNCEEEDEQARRLLESLPGEGVELRELEEENPAIWTDALLAAVPTALWPAIDLTWWVGKSGPLVRFEIYDRETPRNLKPWVGMKGCRFHAVVDQAWARLPLSNRSWRSFTASFHSRTGIGSPAAVSVSPTASIDEKGSLSDRIRAEVARSLGRPGWQPGESLGDNHSQLALAAVESLRPPSSGWFSSPAKTDLMELLAGIDTPAGFGRAQRFFERTGESTDSLTQAWRESGVAAIGYAMLCRDWNPLETPWAVPEVVEEVQLKRLIAQLVRNERGFEQIALLLQGGFASTPETRSALVDAVTAAGIGPRQLFSEVLPRAELSPAVLLELVRENQEAFAVWLQLPPAYAEALRRGLQPRRWFGLRLMPFRRVNFAGAVTDGETDEPKKPAE